MKKVVVNDLTVINRLKIAVIQFYAYIRRARMNQIIKEKIICYMRKSILAIAALVSATAFASESRPYRQQPQSSYRAPARLAAPPSPYGTRRPSDRGYGR